MKKIVSLLLILVMAAAMFTGCGKETYELALVTDLVITSYSIHYTKLYELFRSLIIMIIIPVIRRIWFRLIRMEA